MTCIQQAEVHKFRSNKKRDAFYSRWAKRQRKPVQYGGAGEYIGDNSVLGMTGKVVTIHPKQGYFK